MDNRRDFLKMTSASLPAGVACAFLATGQGSVAADVEDLAAKLGKLPQNIIYTADRPGMWKGKAGGHVPEVSVDGDNGLIVTNHGMSPKHYIVRHTLITKEGEVVFHHTFAPTDEEAESSFQAKAIPKRGDTYYALSFCNLHDLWLAEVKL
jgi:superoxide reductase